MDTIRNALEAKQYVAFMKKRRSTRQFSSEEIDLELVKNAIEIASSAPSGANLQPWFFGLITSNDMKSKIRIEAEKVERIFYQKRCHGQMLLDLKKFKTNDEKKYLEDAPVIIAVFSKLHEEVNGQQNPTYYPLESAGIATGFLISSLHQMGFSTLTHTPKPMGFLNTLLHLDKSYRPFMLIIVGKPHEDSYFPELNKKKLSEVCCLY